MVRIIITVMAMLFTGLTGDFDTVQGCIQEVLGTFALVQVSWIVLRAVHRLLDRWLPFSKNNLTRIFLQLLIGTLLARAGLIAFYIIFPWEKSLFDALVTAIDFVMISYLNIIVNIALIGMHYGQQWKENLVREEKLKRENAQMQLLHLKNQVDPHFLFNAFTSLDSLVQSNPPLASEFIRHLTKIYRHALEHRDKDVSSLHTEIDMLRHYVALQKIRFGDALQIDIEIDKSHGDKGIAAVTLQMLIDNAIKHNEIHPDHPLRIRVYEENGNIVVWNNKQSRKQLAVSDKQGLQQLKQLYALLGNKEVKVENGVSQFSVALPLI